MESPLMERMEKQKKYRLDLRLRAFEKLGGRCYQCGIDDDRVIHFHHIYGNQEKEQTKTTYSRILRGATDILLLCANCHTLWHKEYDEKLLRVKNKILSEVHQAIDEPFLLEAPQD